jgi:4-hydroxybenzoate polyprenyltransferase
VAGIRSSARMFGPRVRPAVAAFFAVAVAFLLAALAGVGAGTAAYGGAALFALHLAWQVRRIDPGNGRLALMLFRSNRDAGLLLFAGLALGPLVGSGT